MSTTSRRGLFGVVVRLDLAVLRSRCAGLPGPLCLAADTSPLDGFRASVARTCPPRPVLGAPGEPGGPPGTSRGRLGPRPSVSNPRLLVGWQTHAVNSQPAPALLFGGVHPRPSPGLPATLSRRGGGEGKGWWGRCARSGRAGRQEMESVGAGSHSMLFMLWALAGSGHRQAHGIDDVPWLPAPRFYPFGSHTYMAQYAMYAPASNLSQNRRNGLLKNQNPTANPTAKIVAGMARSTTFAAPCESPNRIKIEMGSQPTAVPGLLAGNLRTISSRKTAANNTTTPATRLSRTTSPQRIAR